MPAPLAICLEDLDAGPRAAGRFLRCTALPGRQPGLRVGAAGEVQVLRQTAPRVFSVGQRVDTGHVPVDMAVGDVNGDGLPDVAVVDEDLGVTLLTGLADGSLAEDSWTDLSSYTGPCTVMAAGHLQDLLASNLLLGGVDGSLLVLAYDSSQGMGVTFVGMRSLSSNPLTSLATGDLANSRSGGSYDDLAWADGVGSPQLLVGGPLLGPLDPFSAQAIGATQVLVVNRDDTGRDDLLALAGPSVHAWINDAAFGWMGDGLASWDEDAALMASGDFNGDHQLDVVTAGTLDTVMPYSLHHPDLDSVEVLLDVGVSSPVSLHASDLDGDGLDDVVVASGASSSVRLLYSEALPRRPSVFRGLPVAHRVAAAPGALAVADLDRDGRPDLLTTSATAPELQTRRGTGVGMLAAPDTVALLHPATCLAVSDLDADGVDDVVTCHAEGPSVGLYRHDLAAGWDTGTLVAAPFLPERLLTGDVDADGDVDLVAFRSGTAGDAVVGISRQDEAGFGPWTQTTLPATRNNDLVVADMDGDDAADLISGTETGIDILQVEADGTVTRVMSSISTAASMDQVVDRVLVGWFTAGSTPDVVALHPMSLETFVGGFAGDIQADTVAELPPLTTCANPVVADMDWDGYDDVMVQCESEAGAAFHLPFWGSWDALQPDMGRPTPPTQLPSLSALTAAADFDGDGNDDVVVAREGSLDVMLANPRRAWAGWNSNAHLAAPWGAVSASVSVYDVEGTRSPEVVAWVNLGEGADVNVLRAEGSTLTCARVMGGAAPGRALAGQLDSDAVNDYVLVYPDMVEVVSLNPDDPTSFLYTGFIPVYASAVVVGDVDKDRVDEVLVSAQDGTVSVFKDMEPLHGWTISTTPANTVMLVDLDHDGWLDLVTADDASVTVYPNGGATGAPGFQQGLLWYQPGARALAVGDVNQDGHADILVSPSDLGAARVLLGAGDGTVASDVALPAAADPVSGWALADVDGDGRLDVVTVATAGTAGMLDILVGDGQGGFAPWLTYALPVPAGRVDAADLNGDGIPEVLATSANMEWVYMLVRGRLVSNGEPVPCGRGAGG